jgi:hypothetical protein
MNLRRELVTNLALVYRSISWAANVCLFVLLVAWGGTRALAEEGALVFTYEPKTGLVTWARNAAQPADNVAILMIDGPKPLGFPKDSPRWDRVVYMEDHAEFHAANLAFIPTIVGNHLEPGGKPQPLLVYSTGLTPQDFGTITYGTGDLFLHFVTPTWVKASRTVKTTIRFSNSSD